VSLEVERSTAWVKSAAKCGALLAGLILLPGCERQAEVLPGEEPRAPVEVRAAVDLAVATTGDLITFRVTVDYDPTWEVQIPDPGSEIAGFRLVELGRDEPRESRGRVIESRYYQLRADLVGSYVLPPVTVAYRPGQPPDSQAPESGADPAEPWSEATTSEIFVEVESVLPTSGRAEDIRDLKPLRDVRRRPPWLWIGLGSLLAIGVALAIGWWVRRWRRRLSQVPPRPAHEIAFETLATLRRTDFDDAEAVRRFHFQISETIRSYVENRFEFNATDLTTEEILDWLDLGEGPEEGQGEQLGQFLRDTDQVKFAHHDPTRPDIELTYERALRFVEATREPDEPLEEAA
jgi:hypothetical protein